jgi:hypothetical protein
VKAYQLGIPPTFPNLDWSEHPKCLLISIKNEDCGCSTALPKIVETARKSGVEVFFSGSSRVIKSNIISYFSKTQHIKCIEDNNKTIYKGPITFYYIKNNRIAWSYIGYLPETIRY